VLIGLLGELSQDQARSIEEFLTALAGEWSIQVPQGDDEVARRLRREIWKAWWSATDGALLVNELKKRTPSDAERERILGLIDKLGDAAARDKALAGLLAIGGPAVPFLRQAAGERDGKAAEAQKCLTLLESRAPSPFPLVAARLLALRRPAGTAEAILAYLPAAEDEAIAAELRTALGAVASSDGKANPVVVKALEDRTAARRAAAAEALCNAGASDAFAAVRNLLKDADARVRLRTALALAGAQQKDAMPVLIALLTELPQGQAADVEDGLRLLVGDAAPDVSLGDDAASRKKCRDVWEAWWKKSGDKVVLARIGTRQQSMLGFTVVVEPYNQGKRSGRVLELDRRGKVRWEIEGLQGPCDAQVVAGDRVLICEQNNNQVSERDLKGKVLWQKVLNQPVCVQRLSNGNTFIVCRGQIVEYDRNGKEVFTHNRPSFDIICGKKQRNGQITFVTNSGTCIRMDTGGKELKTVRVPPIQVHNGYVDVLSNDHVVVPMYSNHKVVEYDAQGKSVWEASVNMPVSARRLPNGNTLVASMNQRVVELDRAGKIVWENKDPVRPVRADRR
jgi:hypothetical protein